MIIAEMIMVVKILLPGHTKGPERRITVPDPFLRLFFYQVITPDEDPVSQLESVSGLFLR